MHICTYIYIYTYVMKLYTYIYTDMVFMGFTNQQTFYTPGLQTSGINSLLARDEDLDADTALVAKLKVGQDPLEAPGSAGRRLGSGSKMCEDGWVFVAGNFRK